MRGCNVVTSIAVLCVVPLATSAQGYSQVRDGFTVSTGIGLGSGTVSTRSGVGVSGYVRVGSAIRQGLIIGAEATGWSYRSASLMSLSLVAAWYPASTSGLYAMGGGGIGASQHGPGGALNAGLGWDLRMGRMYSLAPFMSTLVVFGPQGGSMVQAGLAVTWH